MSTAQETLFGGERAAASSPKPRPRFDNRYGETGKTEWLTPPQIIHALGEFDLDPCAPVVRPWPMARNHFTIEDDAFKQDWGGARVRKFMNPPYQEAEQPCKRECDKKRCPKRGHHVHKYIPGTEDWLRLLAEEGNGVALIFARTETGIFFPHVWRRADAVLFFDRRLTFYHVSGRLSESNAGAPSCLVAYGKGNVEALREVEAKGVECEFGRVGGKLVVL